MIFQSLFLSHVADASLFDLSIVASNLKVISQFPQEQQPTKIIELIESNPLLAHKIVRKLYESKIVTSEVLHKVVQRKKMSIQKTLGFKKKKAVTITPLFKSASVSINSIPSYEDYYIQYKEKGNSHWLTSIKLEHDPISNSLTTSIVNLKENVSYYIRILNDEKHSVDDIYEFSTNTAPVFSPDNVYKLSDIYTGGTLDLVKLGITGSKNNWVKIVGDNSSIISTTDTAESGINIGANSYLYFENITINGGGRHAISANKAHHLWFNGCDISHWGRKARYTKFGKSYYQKGNKKPINHDSAFSLVKTGVVTIENCHVYSPRTKANSWKYGHPAGANAVLIDARHPEKEYQGQIVIRNNRFYGKDKHRFNDVIESKNNGSPFGGFVRDSAIYNNYFAYANDDLIEIDGSQSNVLVYNNVLEQGFCGISAIPNRQGPSYIFNNYIHNLGDENNKSWAGIKLGGLISRPAGKVNIYNNLIISNSNGIASARFKKDYTYWANIEANVIFAEKKGILQKKIFSNNIFINNLILDGS